MVRGSRALDAVIPSKRENNRVKSDLKLDGAGFFTMFYPAGFWVRNVLTVIQVPIFALHIVSDVYVLPVSVTNKLTNHSYHVMFNHISERILRQRSIRS